MKYYVWVKTPGTLLVPCAIATLVFAAARLSSAQSITVQSPRDPSSATVAWNDTSPPNSYLLTVKQGNKVITQFAVQVKPGPPIQTFFQVQTDQGGASLEPDLEYQVMLTRQPAGSVGTPVTIPIASTKGTGLQVNRDQPDSATLSWKLDGTPSRSYQIWIKQKGKTVKAANNPVKFSVPGTITSGADVTTRTHVPLVSDQTYEAIVSEGTNGPDANDLAATIPPYDKDAAGTSPGVTPIMTGPDPLAERIRAAAEFRKARAEQLRAEGEYLLLQAEARQVIAEAVDLELDNWKKQVVVYFERQQENLLGRMRVRDLYDMMADQTLRLKDTAARRRYEYITRHAGNTGGTHTNLNFMLDQFVGTPLGYGVTIEELFAGGPIPERWTLTPEMHHQLRVKTKNTGAGALEFRLDQPTAIAMDWPVFFRQAAFKPYRDAVESLNEQLSSTTDPDEQMAIVEQLEDAFAYLSRGFFQYYGPSRARGQLSSGVYRRLLRAEEFLHQKVREINLFIENPEQAVQLARTFIPHQHGKDAGTLIAWMNSSGLTFAKPKPGEDATYQRLFNMMTELYALSGEPVMQTPKTGLPVEQPDEAEAEAETEAEAQPDDGDTE